MSYTAARLPLLRDTANPGALVMGVVVPVLLGALLGRELRISLGWHRR